MAKIEKKKKKKLRGCKYCWQRVEISLFVHSRIFLLLSPFLRDDIFCTRLIDLWVPQTWDLNVNERDACRIHVSLRKMLYKLDAYENFSLINFCGLGWKHPSTHFSSSFYPCETCYSFISLLFDHFFNQTKQTSIFSLRLNWRSITFSASF